MLVFVLNKHGEPLMPCKQAKVRHLLKQDKAKVVKRKPFTIQLLYGSSGYKQDVTLGIDPGYKMIGFSVVTEKKELISGEAKLDSNVSRRIQLRAGFRKARRSRLWYRKPRFLNRAKPKGWLAPSVQHRLDSHIRLVNKIKELLPITRIIIEVANFDIQKIKNPDISGTEYQRGDLYNYDNIRGYLIAREHGKCQLCGKEKGNNFWQLHHVIPKRKGGANKSNNLALLHKKCHDKLHKQNLGHKLRKNKQYKDATFMNIIRWKLVDKLKAIYTFGYLTHRKLLEQDLEKTHMNDAFIIAGGINQTRVQSFNAFFKRKNNRKLQLNRKGYKPAIRRQRYSIRPHDIVKWNGKIYRALGIQNKGTVLGMTDETKKIFRYVKFIDVVFHQKGLVFE